VDWIIFLKKINKYSNISNVIFKNLIINKKKFYAYI